MSPDPLVVSFGNADPSQVEKWGAKGAKLAEDFQNMARDFPGMQDTIAIPDGFVLSTEVWRIYHAAGDALTDDVRREVRAELTSLEEREGRRFGDRTGKMPLIVAVRGGAPVSLPGALATILNVGLNDDVVTAMIDAGEDESFVLTTYLSAIRMYGEVVLDIPYDDFYSVLQRYRAGGEGSLSVGLLRDLIPEFKGVLERARHPVFPSGFETDPYRQLFFAVESILGSWMLPIAVEARSSRSPKVPDDMGTAVVVQVMVFGNRDDENCMSGVYFTRDQRTGSRFPVIEWAPKVQCDKIVSGKIRKPLRHAPRMKEQFPDIHERLLMVGNQAEGRARRPLDIEFTVENRKLFILQRRALRMTFNATVRAMWDLVDEGKTSIQMASMIINNALEQPERVLREGFHDYEVLAHGQPITSSADCGILACGTESALELARRGEHVILLRRRPYGETDVAINHPGVRGIIRCDGNTTGHEAVSAVAYCKPYLIKVVDTEGRPLVVNGGGEMILNPESCICNYIGKRVFVDGERGILGYTEARDESVLEDRKVRKKLYVDWEYLREQFENAGYHRLNYDGLLDLHYRWELELLRLQELEKRLRANGSTVSGDVSEEELIRAFGTYLDYIPPRDRERALRLKDVEYGDFDFGPPLVYKGKNLGREVMKVLRTLMLCTTWRTHWVHEAMVVRARERGENENDVIRDIFLKNRTMSILRSFEEEGFHVMLGPDHHFLVLASNFEYEQDPDRINVGPGKLGFKEKEVLARQFLEYLRQVNPETAPKVRMVQGEPPLGQGHARIVSIGLSIPDEEFDLVCRYLRTFLDMVSSRKANPARGQGQGWNQVRAPDLQVRRPVDDVVPAEGFVHLYQLDPFFARYPDFRVARHTEKGKATGEFVLAFGECSFGEFDGVVYGKEGYDRLTGEVKRFEAFLAQPDRPGPEQSGPGQPVRGQSGSGRLGADSPVRPWQFEVDPYRRHSVIAAVGIRIPAAVLYDVLEALKKFLHP